MTNALALGLNALCLIGMQLVWFQGEQTGTRQLWFFGLTVATGLLTASFGTKTAFSGLLRTLGVFFLLANLEMAVCSLPPTSDNTRWNERRRNSYFVGGVAVLIAVLLSFIAAMTNGFSAPAAGLGSRIASLRGLSFILAAIFLLIASAIQWSWSQLCAAYQRPAENGYPITNGVLVIVLFVFLIALVYGDNDAQNLSVFLAAGYLLLLGYANPMFPNDIQWTRQASFRSKFKAAKVLPFIGAVLMLLSVWFSTPAVKIALALKQLKVNVLIFDLVAFAIAFAGAVSVFTRDDVIDGQSIARLQYQFDYAAAYAIVVTIVNLVSGVAGLEAGPFVSTFFAAITLYDFDNGSMTGTSGYLRGGLQLCQLGVLLSTFLKAFPADQPLDSYFNAEKPAAVGFGLVWALLGMLRVPSNYSICFLLSIITYKAVSSGCANWGRTAFYILGFFGVVRSFPLSNSTQYFAIATNDYINSLAWVASAYFVYVFGAQGAPTAPAFDLPTSLLDDVAAELKPVANEPAEEEAKPAEEEAKPAEEAAASA